MLTKTEINNYKSIAHAVVSLEAENVLVGPNSAGKSNFLDALNFVRDAAVESLDHAFTKRHGVNSVRRWSKTRPFNIGIRLGFNRLGDEGEYRFVISSAAGEFSVIEEEGYWCGHRTPFRKRDGEEVPWVKFKRDTSGEIDFTSNEDISSRLPRVRMSESDLFVTQVGINRFSPFSNFFSILHQEISSSGSYSIYPNKIRDPQPISNAEVLADDGSNLASVIRKMRATSQRQNRELLNSSLRLVLPIANEIRIESAGGFYVPVLRVTEPQGGYVHDLNMAQLSDGTLRMLGMLTAFYQPRSPHRITLEEPEQMIHPGLLPVLVDASRDYLEGGRVPRQTLFTTHSPTLLDQFEPSSIIATKFEKGVSKFAKISDRQVDIIKRRLFSAGELLVTEGIIP